MLVRTRIDGGAELRRAPELLQRPWVLAIPPVVPARRSVVGMGRVLLLVLGYVAMCGLPAIVLGGESGLSALSASYRLVRADWGTSAMVYAVMLGVALAGQIANALMIHLPLVNLVASFAIGGF